MKKIDEILDKLVKLCDPTSIFLYGSRARTDFLKQSELEIGVLIPEKQYVSPGTIKKSINITNINIYPFILKDFTNGIIDTPFQKSIYLRELATGGKTIYGKKIIEQLELPPITIVDVMQDLRFSIGYALAATISHRNNDTKTAAVEFYKSCLFGTRSLVLLKKRNFALTYDKIFALSKDINFDAYTKLVRVAYQCRLGRIRYKEADLFKNIAYLTKFVEPILLRYFHRYGNKIIIK